MLESQNCLSKFSFITKNHKKLKVFINETFAGEYYVIKVDLNPTRSLQAPLSVLFS